VVEHHFEKMAAPTRSVCIELAENAEAITAWRDALSEKQRRRLRHPLSITRRWRAATAPSDDRKSTNIPKQNNGPTVAVTVSDAMAAWRRFCSCMQALPPDQAAPLWIEAQARAAEHLSRDVGGSVLGLSASPEAASSPLHLQTKPDKPQIASDLGPAISSSGPVGPHL
jgi:hypothetical protein